MSFVRRACAAGPLVERTAGEGEAGEQPGRTLVDKARALFEERGGRQVATRMQAAGVAPHTGQSALLPFKMVVDLRAENAPQILKGKLAVVPSAGTIGVIFGPGHTLRLLSGLRGPPCRLRREGRECDIDGEIRVVANTHTDAQRLYKLCVAMVEMQPLPPRGG